MSAPVPASLRPALVALALLVAVSVATPARAQIRFGELGFVIAGPVAAAGDVCWGFDCTPRRLDTPAGAPLQFTVRAPLGAPFAIAVAPAGASCLRVPGIWNALVLSAPLLPVLAGTIDQPNGARFCYDGFAVRSLPTPASATGVMLVFQAMAAIGTPPQPSTGFAFSSAVLVALQ
ncbi:MAG: hypothetical protein IPM29_02695 [Planctomycetes bacterium]|nr:hypothetical protein [Planctomycetota bacterium]